jgi:tetratricopeptide (TPR) repeat protein
MRLKRTAVVLAIVLTAGYFAGGQSPAAPLAEINQLLASGDYNGALALSDQALKERPKNAQVLTMRALALRGLRRTKESLKAFDQVLLLKPDNLAALEGASEASYSLKDPAAWDLVQKLIQRAPADPTANAMAGTLSFERGDCQQSIQYFALASAIVAENTTAALEYSQCLVNEGRAPEAVPILEHVSTLASDPAVSYDLAFALFSAGRYAASVARLEQLKTNEAPNAEVLDLLGADYGKLDRVQDALDAYRAACDAAPKDPENYIDLVFYAMEHSSDGAAIKVLDTAIARNPNSSELLTVRGSIYSFIGQPERAEQDFTQAEKADPKSGYGVVGRSLAVRDQGKSSEAEAQLREELKRQSNDAEAKYFLAEIMMNDANFSDYAGVRKLLEDALRQRPDDPNVLLMLGTTYLEQKDPKAALPLLLRAQRIDPNGVSILNRLLQVYRALGMKDEAAKTASVLRDLVDQNRRDEAHRNRFHIDAVPGDPGAVVQR